VVDSLGGSGTFMNIAGRHETFKWWSWGESNPRPTQCWRGHWRIRANSVRIAEGAARS
jgi:hypothetical protein